MIQFTVVYNINNKLRADGTSALQIRAYKDRRRKYFTTAIFIKPTQWSKKHSQVIDHPNAIRINAEIRRRLDALEAYTLELMEKHDEVTLDQLEGYFKYDGGGSFTKLWTYELGPCKKTVYNQIKGPLDVGIISKKTNYKWIGKRFMTL